jgi:hypothetical protein
MLRENPLVLKDPAYNVQVSSLDASWVTWIVRPWCKSADYWTVLTDVHTAVKNKCDEVGIGIAFPQKQIHLFKQANTIKDGLGDPDADEDEPEDKARRHPPPATPTTPMSTITPLRGDDDCRVDRRREERKEGEEGEEGIEEEQVNVFHLLIFQTFKQTIVQL